MLPITRTAVHDIKDFCRLNPKREDLVVEQINFREQICFYCYPGPAMPIRSTVAVWRIKMKEATND
jgi:hypothetical protein